MRKIGIDFGTCNIKGAEIKKNGDIVALSVGKSTQNSTVIPNVILYEPDSSGEQQYKTLFGEVAKGKPGAQQDKIWNIKQYLQEQAWTRTLSFGKKVRVSDVVYDIMKHLYDNIHMANQAEELSAVITVPVNFSKRQRMVVQSAAAKAGFQIRSVISEPFAAFFSLMKDEMEEDHNVLIFDFGGGTLDLCLISVHTREDSPQVVAQSAVGISYGGNQINEDIVKHILAARQPELINSIMQEIPDADTKDADTKDTDQKEYRKKQYHQQINRYHLMNDIDDLKAELFSGGESTEEEVEVHIFFEEAVEGDFGTVAAADLYQMFDSLDWKRRIQKLLNRLFIDSDDLTAGEVTDVFLVGGSSSIPYFRNVLEDYFQKYKGEDTDSLFALNDDLDTEERVYASVSYGAAVYQELLDAGEEEIRIKSRIPFFLYTKGEAGIKCTPLTMHDAYQDYYSRIDPIGESVKKEKKISVYQTIFGEEEKEAYLGDIELSEEMVQQACFYRLRVDQEGTVTAELGSIDMTGEYEDEEDRFCVDWRSKLMIGV